MDEIKLATASNIIKLRTAAGMTQAELGEKLNYSDKSISKWERAEALPDAFVLKRMGDIFGVTVDYLINSHDQWEGVPETEEEKEQETARAINRGMVTMVSITGIWTLAVLLFVVFWSLGSIQWIIFIAALPVSMIALLVFDSLWRGGKENMWIVGGLVMSVFLLSFIVLPFFNQWQMLLLLVPAELIVYLSFHIKKK